MYGYVYLTTNIVNGKQYIGQHKASEYDKRYKGSGKILKYAIEKYGRDKFITIILETYDSKEDLDNGEMFWIAKYGAVENENFYNIDNGGKASGRPVGFKVSPESIEKTASKLRGRKLSEMQRKHISEALKGINAGDKNPARRENVRAKFRILNAGENSPVYGKHWYNNGTDNVIAYSCPEGFVKGKLRKTKNFWFTDGVHEIYTTICPDGYRRGRLRI